MLFSYVCYSEKNVKRDTRVSPYTSTERQEGQQPDSEGAGRERPAEPTDLANDPQRTEETERPARLLDARGDSGGGVSWTGPRMYLHPPPLPVLPQHAIYVSMYPVTIITTTNIIVPIPE